MSEFQTNTVRNFSELPGNPDYEIAIEITRSG